MTNSSSNQYWASRVKWLTQAIIISGTLNIGLIATFIYFVLRDKDNLVTVELKPVTTKSSIHQGMQEFLTQYSTLSFQELVQRLGQSDHVEAGYTRRDLALASLVAFHHFNLERALGGLQLQRRLIAFRNSQSNEEISLTVFPGLADYQYQAIIQYAKTERFPLTPKGLFFELNRTRPPYDPSLLEAFSLTPHFYFTSALFAKTGFPLKTGQVATLLAEGDWETLDAFTAELRKNSTFSLDQRRYLLIKMMASGSKLAAALMLCSDSEFILKRFDDSQIIALLTLIGPKTPPQFSKALLASPRSDAVWKKAAELLNISLTPTTKPVSEERVHLVEVGDSLWKIANKYKVSSEALLKANGLETDRLRIGQKLKIP